MTRRKIVCVALLLLAAGYIAAEPTLEKWFKIDLPSFSNNSHDRDKNDDRPKIEPKDQKNSSAKSNQNSTSTSGKLTRKPAGGKRFTTPQGLLYDDYRIDHVMRHARDIPDRNLTHGVFDANDEDAVLLLVDEAYVKVKNGSRDVRESPPRDGNIAYTVDMKRRIGYEGGKVGKSRGNRECRFVKVVLQKKRVISAYPVRKFP